MYLEVTLPVIGPSLMVISDHGRDTIDFGDIVNGMIHVYYSMSLLWWVYVC